MRYGLIAPIAAATMAVMTLTASLQAQAPRPFRLGLGGGVTLLSGEDRDFFRDGINLAGSVRIAVPALQIGVRLEAAYNGIGGRNKSTSQTGGPDTLRLGDFNVLAAMLSASYDLSRTPGPTRPYLLAGFGVFRTEAEALKYGQPVSGTTTDFGVTAGLGATFRLGGLGAFAEARLHNIFGDGGSARLYPLTFGLIF